eukprot:m.57241 g.57241  ORF g.57241 m.57241 type:complete len:874 (-) comp12097_c1_seq1:69-2690(-)
MFGLFGRTEEQPKLTPAEMIDRLSERIASASLPEDRRSAVRSLHGLTQDHKVEVGSTCLPNLVSVLRDDRQDSELINGALEILIVVTTAERKGDAPPADSDVGVMFTEMFVKNQDNVSALLTLLEDTEYSVRFNTIKLLTTLLSNRPALLQDRILSHRQGVSHLVDLLQDQREVIRNEGLLLLIELTKNNPAIQKIVVFENAFDRIFEVINEEGQSDGSIVVEDCLRLARNLLHANDSNMTMFRESSHTRFLVPFFQLPDSPWSPQRTRNVQLMFTLIRTLVSQHNTPSALAAFQNAMRNIQLLDRVGALVLAPASLPGLLPEALCTVADMVRGCSGSQEAFVKMSGPEGRSALVALLCVMFDAAKPFVERTAALYCFQSCLYRYPEGQAQLCATLLPAAAQQGLSPGQLMCQGLFTGRDPMANWFASLAFCHTLGTNPSCKETALRVAIAREAGKSESLLSVTVSMLVATKPTDTRKRFSLLLLLAVWLSDCVAAVRVLLAHPAAITTLISLMLEQTAESGSLVEGLAAVVFGLAAVYSDVKEGETSKAALRSTATLRIGPDVFTRLIDRLLRSDPIARAQSSQITEERPDATWIDADVASLLRAAAATAQTALAAAPPTPTRALPDPDAAHFQDEVVSSFKVLIQEQDQKYKLLEADMRKTQEGAAQQQQALVALQTELSHTSAALAEAKSKQAAAERALAEAQVALQSVPAANGEDSEVVRALRADLHEALEQNATKDETIASLQAQLQSGQAALSSALANLTALQQTVAQHEAAAGSARVAAEAVTTLEAQIASMAAEKDALNQRVAALEAAAVEEKNQFQSLTTEHDDLLVCLAENETRLKSYRERLRAAGAAVSEDETEDEADEGDF